MAAIASRKVKWRRSKPVMAGSAIATACVAGLLVTAYSSRSEEARPLNTPDLPIGSVSSTAGVVAPSTAPSTATPANPTTSTATSGNPTRSTTGRPPSSGSGFGPDRGRPFSEVGFWNSPIAADPILDPNSAAMAAYLGAEGRASANLYEFGIPIFYADASTRRYDVRCTKPWGTCGLEREPVPVPDGAGPNDGSDGVMVIIDWSTRKAYEFWQARSTADGWVTSWGGIVPIDGPGVPGDAVGAGVSRLAGVVRTYELQAGSIPHALVFSTDNACSSTFREPAAKTDGSSTAADCIPEGARIQLDPGIDVDAVPGITPAERAVAKALQTYGAYVIDNGGARMGFSFEMPTRDADPYPAAGLGQDYDPMERIPWNRIRVLRQWDGR